MGYQNETPIFKLPQWGPSDYMDWLDWNTAWQTIEKGLGDFSYLIDTYGYSMKKYYEGGKTVLEVSASSKSPVPAKIKVEITKKSGGAVDIIATTEINGEKVVQSHSIDSNGGKGEIADGI